MIGIAIGNTIGHKSGSRYWTPLTLIVEDAQPTHVVITFPSAKTVLASDFTITGITTSVLNGSWTGSVYTLVLSVPVIYGNLLSVVYKGKSYSVTNNVTWAQGMTWNYTNVLNTHATWTSAQRASILSLLSEDYIVTTFGPAGANKSVCDFFIFLEVASNGLTHTATTNTKSGAILRWNFGGGNVYSQNNLPAQISLSIVGLTSTDGFGGVTRFSLYNNGFIGNIFNIPYYMPNVTYLDIRGVFASGWYMVGDMTGWQFKNTSTVIAISSNRFTGDLTGVYIPDYIATYYITGNRFTGAAPYFRSTYQDAYAVVQMDANRFTSLMGTKFGLNLGQYYLSDNCFSTSEITSHIQRMADYYTGKNMIENLALKLTGNYNGTITDGESNAGLIALRAAYVAGSNTLTLTYNASTEVLVPLSSPFLAVCADDGNISDYTKLFPMMTARGKVGTTYVEGGALGSGGGYITVANLLTMKASGWDIQDHTFHHALYGQTEAYQRSEYTTMDALAITDGLDPFHHIAYPSGLFDALVKAVAADYRLTGRSTTIYSTPVPRGGLVYKDNLKFEISVIMDDLTSQAVVDGWKGLVDYAKIKSAGLIIGVHGLTDTQTAYLAQVVDYAIAQGLGVGSISQLYAKMIE